MRLPAAILGVATVGLLFAMLRRRFGLLVAASAAGVLALDPWHVALTRTAHESAFAPFFLAVALLALCRSELLPPENAPQSAGLPHSVPPARRGVAWAAVAGLAIAMHTWVYPATRLFTPLFVGAMLLVYRRHILASAWRAAMAACIW